MNEQYKYSSAIDFLHLVHAFFQGAARFSEDEVITPHDLAEKLGLPEKEISTALEHATSLGIIARHGQPGAWYYGRKNGLVAPGVVMNIEVEGSFNTETGTYRLGEPQAVETITATEVPNRRAAIVFMHPEETAITVLDNGQIELEDEFNEVILTAAVAKKLLEALGFIGGY